MKQVTAEQRFSLYYAVLFGSIGAVLPFAALWMHHIGIEPSTIGIIMATPSVAMLLTTISLGRVADNLADRRQAIIAGNWMILLTHLTLFIATDTWVVLLVWLVAGVTMYAKVPITDASALSLTLRNGSDYARIRMFGSIGFVLMLGIAGLAYERWGVGIFVAGLCLANVIRLLAAYCLPSMPRAPISDPRTVVADAGVLLYQPVILLTLAGAALINASHAMVNTYGILLWTQQGLSESTASLAVGIGVVVEVVLMWWFRSLTQHVSARACLLVAAACGMLRWSLLASEPSLLLLFAAQMLHGVTFGIVFLASASFISRRVPEHAAARGQGLLATISTACMAMSTFGCGQLFNPWGDSLYWLMGGLCVLATVSIGTSYRFKLAER